MRHYREFWLLLALAFAFFFVLSAFDGVPLSEEFELCSAGFAKAAFPEAFSGSAEDSSAASEALRKDSMEVAVAPAALPAPTDTAAQAILFIGDSMLDGLSPRMEEYCRQNGHRLLSVRWYSSSTRIWAASGHLKEYIGSFKPSHIFICLGANELFIRDVDKKCGSAVDKIIEETGSVPYTWIGPPNWKPDTGINDLLEKKTLPGSFFLSDGMHFERRKDGAHPTPESAALWLDSVARWMPLHSSHPIRMDVPRKPLPAKEPGRISVKLLYPQDK